MLSKIESILFVIFIISTVLMTWVPMGYLFRNIKGNDFDFFRDILFYWNTVKARYSSPIGKIATSYIILYALFCISKLFLERNSLYIVKTH